MTTAQANAAHDSELADRVNRAEAIVSGVVIETKRLETQRPAFLSQHNPDWHQAVIQVDTVEKGHITTKDLPVFYAASSDIAWFQSPKLSKGDRGIWLLQNKDPFGKDVPGLAVVKPLDRQPIENLTKVRSLLQNNRDQQGH